MSVTMIIPSGDMVHMDFAMCTWALLAHMKNDMLVINPRTSIVEVSRYTGVRKAIDQGADEIFFVDSDTTFPADGLARLQSHDLPFVGATYMTRRHPHTALGVPFEEIKPEMTGLRKMQRMPIGFSLIKTAVFDAIEPPWFPVTWDPVQAEHTSEDYNFCELVKKAGFDLWVDLDLSHELGHMGTQTFRWNR